MRLSIKLHVQRIDYMDYIDDSMERGVHLLRHSGAESAFAEFTAIQMAAVDNFVMVPYTPFHVPPRAGRCTLHGGIRYAVLVPNGPHSQHRGIGSMRRILVVCLWPVTIALFAVLRWLTRMAGTADATTTAERLELLQVCTFDTLARSLGTTATSRSTRLRTYSEQQLIGTLSVFALLTCAIFAGILFEALLDTQTVYHINSVADLLRAHRIPVNFPLDLMTMVPQQYWSDRIRNPLRALDSFEMARRMLRINVMDEGVGVDASGEAFIVHESLLVLLDDERLRFANGAAVYRVLSESFRRFGLHILCSMFMTRILREIKMLMYLSPSPK